MWHFENTYSKLSPKFFKEQNFQNIPVPKSIIYNQVLAWKLGIEDIVPLEKVSDLLSWNILFSWSYPLSQAYAGHQFGHFTMLGDGRATLLWEWVTDNARRYDVVLKWSGATYFSRGGDGYATLKSMLREYLISEAMYALKIPTSRSLAVVTTGTSVIRDSIEPWAILTRIMSSHIRVGTFEYAKVFCSQEELKQIIDYTIARHYPELEKNKNPIQDFLQTIIEKQTDLIIEWLRVGFIHGVMNTDNTSIAWETFDYGPCAFMNAYHPDRVFSSIDMDGRYAYWNQPYIIGWNLSVLAYTLSDFIDTSSSNKILQKIPQILTTKWNKMMWAKIGISEVTSEDVALINELLIWMQEKKADYTNTFLYLGGIDIVPDVEVYTDTTFQDFLYKWEKRIWQQSGWIKKARKSMKEHNPIYIPRNHIVEEVLDIGATWNMSHFHDFLDMLKTPYQYREGSWKYMDTPRDFDATYQTFCGT